MIFCLGSCTPLVKRAVLRWFFVSLLAILVVFCASCGSSSSHPFHNAYISFPGGDTIGLFHLDNASGELAGVSKSVPLTHTGPKGLALHPSGKFLYAANSTGNSVSVFNVGGDGTLSQNGTPVPAGVAPYGAVIDPSGAFLLVTNNISNSISVFSIDSGSGALTLTNTVQGLPNPTEILMTPSGNFVYVLTPSTNNTVWGFTYSSGTLTAIPGSPFLAGRGTTGIAVDPGEHFIYTANTTDYTVSAFTINTGGVLTGIVGSPYFLATGAAPSTLAVDTTGKFLYVATTGSPTGIWGFSISSVPGSAGELTPVTGSPFSLSVGNLFMVMEPRGQFFYIGNHAGNISGYTYDTTTGMPTVIIGSPFGVGSAPGALLITH